MPFQDHLEIDVRGSTCLRTYGAGPVIEVTLGEVKSNGDISEARRQLSVALAVVEQAVLALTTVRGMGADSALSPDADSPLPVPRSKQQPHKNTFASPATAAASPTTKALPAEAGDVAATTSPGSGDQTVLEAAPSILPRPAEGSSCVSRPAVEPVSSAAPAAGCGDVALAPPAASPLSRATVDQAAAEVSAGVGVEAPPAAAAQSPGQDDSRGAAAAADAAPSAIADHISAVDYRLVGLIYAPRALVSGTDQARGSNLGPTANVRFVNPGKVCISLARP